MLRGGTSPNLLPVSNNSLGAEKKKSHRGGPSNSCCLLTLAGVAFFLIAGIYGWNSGKSRKVPNVDRIPTTKRSTREVKVEPLVLPETAQAAEVKAKTLVLYVYAGSDPEAKQNLLYFLREGVQEHDGCDYVIAVQEGGTLEKLDPLPKLPANARFVRHENKCFDLGTIGWMLDTKVVNPSKYQYVIWLNSSVRGPFLPVYVKRRMHWTEALTDRITGKVKMVGATINCGGAYDVPQVPHVQSYLVAVDQVGFSILRKAGNVFQCWDTMQQTVIHSELGASAAIFLAGYSIDCLMLRYQGVNWRSKEALDCNSGLNPIQYHFNDGINVGPLEAMFTKVKSSMRGANWTHVQDAVKFDEWNSHEKGLSAADLRANEWFENWMPRLYAEAAKQGIDCFDFEFYLNATPWELGHLWKDSNPAKAAWDHFLSTGIAEGRPYRFKC